MEKQRKEVAPVDGVGGWSQSVAPTPETPGGGSDVSQNRTREWGVVACKEQKEAAQVEGVDGLHNVACRP